MSSPNDEPHALDPTSSSVFNLRAKYDFDSPSAPGEALEAESERKVQLPEWQEIADELADPASTTSIQAHAKYPLLDPAYLPGYVLEDRMLERFIEHHTPTPGAKPVDDYDRIRIAEYYGSPDPENTDWATIDYASAEYEITTVFLEKARHNGWTINQALDEYYRDELPDEKLREIQERVRRQIFGDDSQNGKN